MDIENKYRTIIVWDIWVRISHWLMAILFVLAIISSKTENYDVHVIVSSLLVGVVLFRIIWGFVGSENTKIKVLFSNIKGWSKQLTTIFSRQPVFHTSHTAIGSLMSLVILLLLLSQGFSSLFFKDFEDYTYVGILASYFPEFKDLSKSIHEIVGNTLIFLTIFHVLASLYYWIWKRSNLIWLLVTGSRQRVNSDVDSINFGSPPNAIISIFIVAILVFMIYHLF